MSDVKNRYTGEVICTLDDVKSGKCRDLSEANLRGANLRGANLRGANLSEANLSEADLRGADLRGANLREADLSEADLRGANLRGADLRGANLSEAVGDGLRIKTLTLHPKFPINIFESTVFIGCQPKPWQEWLTLSAEDLKSLDFNITDADILLFENTKPLITYLVESTNHDQ